MKKEFSLRKAVYIVLFLVCALMSVACGCNEEEKPIENSDVLSLDKSAITVYVGETVSITANTEDVIWASNDETVATVNNGTVSGIKFGKTVVTATKGDQTASCEVTVKEKPIAEGNFYLTAEKTSIFKNRSISISAVMYFGEQLIDGDDLNFSWTSSNENIATVDQNGRVTGIDVGSAIITCKVNYNNKEYTDEAEIEVEAFTVLLSDREEITIASGNTLSGKTNSNNADVFTFKAYDEDERLLDINTEDVTYSSSDNNVVTVDESGKLTAVNTGNATVTALYVNNVCSVSVKVVTSINCIDDMNALAFAEKNGNGKLWDSTNYYIMTSDIDYDNTVITPIGICGVEGYSWRESFGNLNPKDRSFDATFDGNGYTIKNALIAESLCSGSSTLRNCVFGYTTGTVKNICFDTIKFETTLETGNSGIFSQMYGTIENILVLNGLINASASSSTGFFSSAFLVGTLGGKIKNCIVEANVDTWEVNRNTALIYSNPTGNYSVENTYAIDSTGYNWVHFYSTNSPISEDDTCKFVSMSALNSAIPELFGEDSLYVYDEADGIYFSFSEPSIEATNGLTYTLSVNQSEKIGIKKKGDKNIPIIFSSDNDCVSVDEDGTITGVSNGTANVTATFGSKTLTFNVSVVVVKMQVVNSTIDINTIKTLSGKDNAVDSTKTFAFKILDENDKEITNIDKSKLTLSSNNPQVKFDKDNLTFTVTPQDPTDTVVGPYTVTVSYMGASCSATVNVAVAINCIEDMEALAKLAQQGYGHLWGASFVYRLTADIDYNNTAIMPVAICGVEGYTWQEAFGNLNPQDISFAGTFDGDGHTIKNVLIAEALTSGTQSARNCVFGYITGTVKNICFDTVKFETQKTMINSGMFSQMYGTVENILVLNGDINANARDYNEGFMASAFLAGTVDGTIRNCIIEAGFSGSGNPAVPGLIYSYGTANRVIQNVYAVSSKNHTWVHYHSSGAVLDEDGTCKFNTEADLYDSHSEMFGENSAFVYDETNGIALR